MQTNRRNLIKTAIAAGASAIVPGSASAQFLNAPRHGLPGTLQERYAKLDEVLSNLYFGVNCSTLR